MASQDIVTILVALIGAEAIVLAAMLPLIFSTRKHARSANNQVSNDHSTNLREELDSRHRQDVRWRAGLGRRLGRIDRRLDTLEGRVDAVDERTQPSPTPTRRKS